MQHLNRLFVLILHLLSGCSIFRDCYKNRTASAFASSVLLRFTLHGSLFVHVYYLWGGSPDARSREIFLAIYENLSDPEFSLQTIAQERLFMSEDHLRRIFSQMTGTRFSGYLENCRITQARRLLEYQPDMKISRLAELVGYPLDGQYFSKVFRKICGVTPTEYRSKY